MQKHYHRGDRPWLPGYWVNKMIRKTEPTDIPRIAEIVVYGWRCAFREILSDEVLFSEQTVAMRIARLEKSMPENTHLSNFVYDDGLVKAAMTIGASGEKHPNALELWAIYVDPFFQRQGIGEQLLNHCEAEAAARGFREVRISTFQKNVVGRQFYEKMGYSIEGNPEYSEQRNAMMVKYLKILNRSKNLADF